ncbi:hypothetical protein [Streptomyces sp. NPDC023838]|uniref:hypothetical protein n=1 Tax=Streptomyces sp. NPDC023838 TaxID=3154325 RepID=UPI0033C56A62
MTTPCPAHCGRQRHPRQYLCPTCWDALPTPAKRALGRRGPHAMTRLRELHRQIAAGVPLGQIAVTP